MGTDRFCWPTCFILVQTSFDDFDEIFVHGCRSTVSPGYAPRNKALPQELATTFLEYLAVSWHTLTQDLEEVLVFRRRGNSLAEMRGQRLRTPGCLLYNIGTLREYRIEDISILT
jgi:hypothetical protein